MTAISPLRARATWDPRFVARSPWLAPFASAAALLADCEDWPPVSVIDARLGPVARVRFVPAMVRARTRAGRRRALDPKALYDARIVEEGVVPTRERTWHDLLNALVWATWPRAKAALHARQHRIVRSRLAPDTTHLPSARTREGDTIAMLDEGGVLLARGTPLLFGHALAEGLLLDPSHLVARTISVDAPAADLSAVDVAFASLLRDDSQLHHPTALGRLLLDG